MDEREQFLTGLANIIKWRGAKAAPLSRKAGMGETAIRDFFRKRAVPSVSNAKSLAVALGVTIEDIFIAASGHLPTGDRPTTQFLSIPKYDILLSAGHGTINLDHASALDHIPFTQAFLEQKMGRSTTEGLICADSRGESMLPIIGDGDLLMINTKHCDLSAGIYAVNYGEESFVKRIEKIDRGYSLLSDNPAYPPIIVKGAEVERLQVVGKVVWVGRALG